MTTPATAAYVAAAYLLGSIPFGLLFGRLAGIDVRRGGSGNIGATNVNRLLGRKFGLATLACDIGKGMAAMWAARMGGAPETVVLLCGFAAFLGHLFPLYLGFAGGKGVATALGVFLFLDPAACGIAAAVFLLLVRLSGFVSVGSLGAAAAMPLALLALGAPAARIYLACAVAVLVWLKHRQNIVRLLRGEEKGWKKAGP